MNSPSRPSRNNMDDCHWGNCPSCGETDGYLNIGNAHWVICHQHRVRWLVGTNLMSSWQFELEELGQKGADALWDANWECIKGYRELADDEPWYPAENVADNLLQAIDEPLFP